jgi:clan AA aspartic protease (TIGR02281 family)
MRKKCLTGKGENMRTIILMLAVGALNAQPAIAQKAAPEKAADDVVDTDVDNSMRMTVPVMINGQGPFQFVIDTGADRTVISAELAARLTLPEAGMARLHTMSGESKVRTVKIDRVQISNNVVRNVKAAALPARYVGADGLLGIDSLKGQRIVMDFEAKTMKVVPSTEPEEKVARNTDVIVVTARTKLGQLVMVDADANGQKIWVVVDTGAQNSVGNSKLRTMLVKRNPKTEIRVVNMIDVIGRRTVADYTIVDKVRIGGIRMGNAAIAFADAHPFRIFGLGAKPSMLLGMESLRSFKRVSVDFVTRKIKFLLPTEGMVGDNGTKIADQLPVPIQAETSPAT